MIQDRLLEINHLVALESNFRNQKKLSRLHTYPENWINWNAWFDVEAKKHFKWNVNEKFDKNGFEQDVSR